MKVMFIPYGEANAYHGLLETAVREAGFETTRGSVQSEPAVGSLHDLRAMLLPILWYVLKDRDISVVHVVWTHQFFVVTKYDSRLANTVVSAVRSVIFLCNVLAVKALGVRVVWTVHNKYNHEKHHKRLDLWTSRRFVRLCDAVTVECDRAKSVIVDLFGVSDPGVVTVVPEGNYLPAYEMDADRTTARDRLGIDKETFLFLHFGFIRPYKGVPELISAFRELGAEDAELLIAGNTLNESIQSAVESQSAGRDDIRTVLEYVPDEEVQYYMAAADVVVLPYRDILTSGSALLAASFGKPVVAPRIGCVPSILTDEGGFLYDREADGALVETMRETLQADLAGRGAANRERAKELSWDRVGRETVAVYESVLPGASRHERTPTEASR